MSGFDLFIGGMLCAGIFACIVVVGIIVFLAYTEIFCDKIVLRKSDWICTKSHIELQPTTILMDGALISSFENVTVSDQWTRR